MRLPWTGQRGRCEPPSRAPIIGIRAFAMAGDMLTIRPNPRARIPGSTARIISAGAMSLASCPAIHASSSQSAIDPGGGPALLVARMSGSGHAASRRRRASWVPTSPTTGITSAPVAAWISSWVALTVSSWRPLTTGSAPSWASAAAHASPRPSEDAMTIAAAGESKVHGARLQSLDVVEDPPSAGRTSWVSSHSSCSSRIGIFRMRTPVAL
jgi:hypothetical protein